MWPACLGLCSLNGTTGYSLSLIRVYEKDRQRERERQTHVCQSVMWSLFPHQYILSVPLNLGYGRSALHPSSVCGNFHQGSFTTAHENIKHV